MPDIFGRSRTDYSHIQIMDEDYGERAWDDHHNALLNFMRANSSSGRDYRPHDFDSLGSGERNADLDTRAPGDAQALGYITNTGLQIMTMVDEIYYTANRLTDFVALNTSINEGAQTYGYQVLDRVGQAKRIEGPGFEAPSATVSRGLVTKPLHLYGIDAIYSVEDMRQAIFQGIPLATTSIEAAVTGCMETMEQVAFTGGDYGSNGLFNWHITGENAVNHRVADNTFEGMLSVDIRTLINKELSAVIEASQEVIGRQPGLMTGMTVYLPGEQYDSLSNLYIGDNAEKTLMKSILEDNPWTNFSKQPLSIVRVLELSGIASGNRDRMVVGLKNPRVAEMGVAIDPRVLRILDEGRNIKAQVEAKFSELFVRRPSTIRYVDGI